MSRPLPRAARAVLAGIVAALISLAYIVQSTAQSAQQFVLVGAEKDAVAARVAAAHAGVPDAVFAIDDAELGRLQRADAPQVLPFIDQAWNQWAAREQQGFSRLAGHFRAAPAAYQASLLADTHDALGAAASIATDWAAAGGAAEDLDPARARLAAIEAGLAKADIPALTVALAQARTLLDANRQGLALQAEDNQKAAAYTQQELPQATASLSAEQARATQLTYDARGNVEAAQHFNVPGADRLAARVERHAAATAATDPTALAGAVAWLRVDGDRVQAAMQAAMPARAIYISTGRQELRAYDHGNLSRQTLVTTGRPELPTVVGSFHVLWKTAPWTMHSPFPQGTPFWYPDTQVQMVLWFAEGGYGIHDAAWRSTYGPGTNISGPVPGTHGCVNVPYNDEAWLYGWAQVGDAVTVG